MLTEQDKTFPRYYSFSKLRAVKIGAIKANGNGSATITPANEGVERFVTDVDWGRKFRGDKNDLGYYVIYDCGHKLWLSSKEFEGRYSKQPQM